MSEPVDWALIKDGVVQAIALHPVAPDVFGVEPDGEVLSFASGSVRPKMLWDGESLTAPEPEPVAPPEQVAMWRIRVILAEDGLLDDVDAAVASLPQPIQERWKGAPNFVRNSPLVQGLIDTLGPTLGLDTEAVDDILVRAAALAE